MLKSLYCQVSLEIIFEENKYVFTVHIYYNVKISGGRFSGEKNMWREILDEISNEQGGTKIMHAYITQKKKKKKKPKLCTHTSPKKNKNKNKNYARIASSADGQPFS